ncbi:MAG: amino acid adenylation domain-containing protein [Candidatus Aminicenantes bacterium]|nr:amino acid adenylation domain-containing protein [Candidatus Aminicenantes bacterium]
MLARKFEEQVKKIPHKLAVKTIEREYTYLELNRCANGIAHRVTAAAAGGTAALLFEHGVHMIAAILGSLKAGKVYVPLSADYPADRLSYMLSDSGAAILLTDTLNLPLAQKLSRANDIPLVNIDSGGSPPGEDENDPVRDITADKPAYILYTSGSTGRPKGVLQTHENADYYNRSWVRVFSITSSDRMTLFSSFCHDGSVQDMYSALYSGAALFPVNMKKPGIPVELSEFLLAERITIWHSVPSLFTFFANTLDGGESLPDLRFILLGGEAVREHEVEMCNKYFPHSKLANVYGQTESSVNSIHIFPEGGKYKKPLLGTPLDKTRLFVVDEDGDPVKTLQTGEILVACPHISPGYWKNQAATEEVFDQDEELGRIYWSGDLGRLLMDGGIEFLGRGDAQVKIRGFRVELGEIETWLMKHESVREAVVVMKERPGDKGVPGDKYLCAYVVSAGGDAASSVFPHAAELQAFLSRLLPDYMVPAYFVQIDKMPLTPTNKIDRRALPEPILEAGEGFAAPVGEVEEKLVETWSEVLGLEKDKISVSGNFFELGGHSLKALSMISKTHRQFDVRVPLPEVFRDPTIRALAGYIKAAKKEEYTAIEPAPEKDCYALSSAQKRLFILEQQGGLGTAYNMPGALRIAGPINNEILERTLSALIGRHESFRTSFHMRRGEAVQEIAAVVEFKIKRYDLGSGGSVEQAVNGFFQPFELSAAPLLRAGLITLSPREHILLFDMHHIISDGISVDILMREFVELYTGMELPELRVQYKDFSEWQNRFFESPAFLQQEKYWQEALKGELPRLRMPLDFERPKNRTFSGSTLSFAIESQLMEKLDRLARGQKVTLNILMLSLYFLLLSKYSDQEDIIVGSLVSGRNHADLENVIGMFANFLPIRSRIDPGRTFGEFLETSRQVILAAYENQDCPFERIIDLLDYPVDLARNPLFDTMVVFHNEFDPTMQLEIDRLKFSPYPLPGATSTLDFKLDIRFGTGKELLCHLEYDTGLFKAETMQRFIEHFRVLIDLTAEDPDRKIAGIEIFSEKEEAALSAGRELAAPAPRKALPLVVGATFTADPVRNYILWWGESFGLEIDLVFAPYNQVFRELLDEESRTSTNKGINLLLIRFEDWIRDLEGPDEEKYEKLEQDFENLTNIFKNKKKTVPYLIGLFPIAEFLSFSPLLKTHLTGLYRRWRKVLEESDNTYVIDFTSLKERYAVEEIFDPLTDKEGHLPFTGQFYAAMGTAAARKICALDSSPFKVIVLDCDNTLWRGICGEDGAEGVKIDGPYRALQQFMLDRYEEGFLLALCSKNNEADVWEVFEKNPGMVLRKEHLVGWRINWQPKSGNLKELAVELNLGSDSFIFLDDSGVECTEVSSRCPEVLTLRLPGNPESIPLFLAHTWAFDKLKVTGEDRSRTQLYRAEKKRKEVEQESLTLDGFLKGLELKISMNFMEPGQVERVSQLTRRTNQFNLSTIRRREEEILELVKEPGIRCWVIEVSDRFGAYGLVGLVITKEKQESLFVDTFLLSCRVLGRGVEEAILAGLRKYCEERRLVKLEADYYPTKKNKPLFEFLQAEWILEKEHGEERTTFVYPFAKMSEAIEYADFYYLEKFAAEAPRQTVEKKAPQPVQGAVDAEQPGENKGKAAQPALSPPEWDVGDVETSGLLHRRYLLPLKNYRVKSLLELPTHKFEKEKIFRKQYEQPQNETQGRLVEIWEEILQEERIGVNETFFELGGNSLKAMSLLSGIHKEFNVELTLKDVFDNKTVRELSCIIDNAGESVYSSIEAAEKRAFYPLSSAQKRLYVLQQLDPESRVYNMPAVMILEGSPGKEKLYDTFCKMIERHEGFRTSFHMSAEEPVQQVHEADEIEFEIEYVEDAASLAGKSQPSLSSGSHTSGMPNVSHLAHRFIRPFDLSRAPLLRVVLVKIEDRKHILIVDRHHIVYDGSSSTMFFRDFTALYSGSGLPPLELQYKDYATWLSSPAVSEAKKKQESYWQDMFAGEVPVLNLPLDYPRPAVQDFAGSRYSFSLGEKESGLLKALAEAEGVTLFMLLLTIFNVLLMKLSGQEDIVVGTPAADRRFPGLEQVIGMFVNTLAVRNYPRGDKSFREFLFEVKERTLSAFGNREYPFEELVEQVDVKRDLSRNPLFDVMFGMHNFAAYTGGTEELEAGGLQLKPYRFDPRTSVFDIYMAAVESGDSLLFNVEYRTKLFKAETIERFMGYYRKIACSISHILNKNVKLADIEIMPETEKRQVLLDFNDTEVDYPRHKTIHGLFEQQAASTPDHTAIVGPFFSGGQVSLTYKQLNESAQNLAGILISKGVKPGVIVGLMVERTVAMMVGIMGILKTGGTYLPIDPVYPQVRIKYVLDRSGASLLLTQQDLLDSFEHFEFDKEVLDINGEYLYESGKKKAAARSSAAVQPTGPAYVIYTSGSTGNPKGVAIEHRNVVNFVKGMTERIDFVPGKSILALTTISFDIFVLETLLPLIGGIKIVLAGETEQKDPQAMARIIKKNRVDMLQVTPSRLNLLLNSDAELACLQGITEIMVGGEAFPEKLFDSLKQNFRGRIFNMYGPTETTVWSAVKDLTGVEKINIGSPIANTQIYIVDKNNRLQPPGIAGELLIGGDGVGRGYLNNPELTAEKFQLDVYRSDKSYKTYKAGEGAAPPPITLYRTGDLARWLPGGEIDFLGRLDYQVKIRGFRIELEEIEDALQSYREKKIIKEAVVVDRADSDGVKYLIAYMVAAEEITVSELRRYLTGKLPDYMIPAHFAQVEKIPLTPNGKIDRRALDKYGTKLAGGAIYEEPRNALEEKIAAVWKEILNVEKVGIHDNYFELGGNSLNIIKINRELQEVFQKDIPVVAMFRYTTVHALAGFLGGEEQDIRDRKSEMKRGKASIHALRKRKGGKNG